MCKAIARYQPPHADEQAKAIRDGDPSDEELDKGAEEDLLLATRHAPDVEVSF